jgi:hypothetical protein
MREQFGQAMHRMYGNARERIAEPGEWLHWVLLRKPPPEQTRPFLFPLKWIFAMEPNGHPKQLDGAVTRVNALLDPAGGFRLSIGTTKPASGQKSIPVSLVHGTFVSDADSAMIADGRCIFVNRDWKDEIGPLFGEDTAATMDLELSNALAIILLHEIGHIQPAALPDNAAITELVASLGSGKQKEMPADAFAAR